MQARLSCKRACHASAPVMQARSTRDRAFGVCMPLVNACALGACIALVQAQLQPALCRCAPPVQLHLCHESGSCMQALILWVALPTARAQGSAHKGRLNDFAQLAFEPSQSACAIPCVCAGQEEHRCTSCCVLWGAMAGDSTPSVMP